jgi:hypothetical protein
MLFAIRHCGLFLQWGPPPPPEAFPSAPIVEPAEPFQVVTLLASFFAVIALVPSATPSSSEADSDDISGTGEGKLVCWILLGWISPRVSVAVIVTDGLSSSLRSMFMRYFDNIAFRCPMAHVFAAVEVSTSVTCPAIVEIVSSISFCLVSRADILLHPSRNIPNKAYP